MSHLKCNLESDFCVVIVIIFFVAIICICCWFCNFIYPCCKLNKKYKETQTNKLEY